MRFEIHAFEKEDSGAIKLFIITNENNASDVFAMWSPSTGFQSTHILGGTLVYQQSMKLRALKDWNLVYECKKNTFTSGDTECCKVLLSEMEACDKYFRTSDIARGLRAIELDIGWMEGVLLYADDFGSW